MRPGPGLRLLISKKRRGVRGSHQKAAGACIAAGCEVNNARAATSRPGRTQDHKSKQAWYSALALAGKTYAVGGLCSHARGQSVDSRLTPDRMRPGSYREFGRFPRAPFRTRARVAKWKWRTDFARAARNQRQRIVDDSGSACSSAGLMTSP